MLVQLRASTKETDVDMHERKTQVTLLLVPRDTKGSNPGRSLILVIGVTVCTIGEEAIGHWGAVDTEVILILWRSDRHPRRSRYQQ